MSGIHRSLPCKGSGEQTAPLPWYQGARSDFSGPHGAGRMSWKERLSLCEWPPVLAVGAAGVSLCILSQMILWAVCIFPTSLATLSFL